MPLKPVAGLLAVVLTFAGAPRSAAGSASEGGALRTIASAPPVAINLSELLGDENEPEEDENEARRLRGGWRIHRAGRIHREGRAPAGLCRLAARPAAGCRRRLGLVAVALAVRLLRRLRAWVGRMGRAAG